MNVAVLFNADHPDLGGWCRASVMRRLLETKVLQSDDRNMRVSVGDILTFSAVSRSADRTYAHLVRVCRALYRPADLDLLIADRLEATHGKATVFCSATPEHDIRNRHGRCIRSSNPILPT